MHVDILGMIKAMTLEEKAGVCSGLDFWRTKPVPGAEIPSVMVADGPHGLRKQENDGDHLGIAESVKAICFPTGTALASSFDRQLIQTLGETLGQEARAENLHTLLGPAINIKRSPLGGRNFEYLSEDPYLAGEMAAHYVTGVQSQGVGVSVKHFAANNQEDFRMSTDTLVDEQTLREIYLPAFEKTVKQAKPWTLMCAYNRINGTYCCENRWLLTDVLRNEWGFDGIVMTDWGAMHDRVKALKAGLNLEMPSSYGLRDREIVEAVHNGSLPVETLDHAVEELLTWIYKGQHTEPSAGYDRQAHHAEARRIAGECAVLLKNEKQQLPLQKEQNIAILGAFAKYPRFQGGGSSHINPCRVESAADAAQHLEHCVLEPGMCADGETADDALLDKAVKAAKAADAAVLFVGLPDSFESEGYDRKHLELPACQNQLIEKVAAVQPHTVIVLHNGSPVAMPWIGSVAAVLEMHLGGQAVGAAALDILFGDVNPSGKLAETFPRRLEDTPAYLNYPGNSDSVRYAEGLYVGYRWYDSRNMEVLFPFGFGLSYTQFKLSKLKLSSKTFSEGIVRVTVTVKNTGIVFGKEVVQLYVAQPKNARIKRPVHELKGFAKVALAPGEAKEVIFYLDQRSFAYYETRIHDWHMEPGQYQIQVGTSSRDLPLRAEVEVTSAPLPFAYQSHTTIGDLMDAGNLALVKPYLGKLTAALGGVEAVSDDMQAAMITGMPVHSIPSFIKMKKEELDGIETKMREITIRK